MKQKALIIAVLTAVLAGPALAADCFADYKAKKENPLRLHYGVVQLSGECSKKSARKEVAKRISRDGWILMKVNSVFTSADLSGKESDAGKFYLRY